MRLLVIIAIALAVAGCENTLVEAPQSHAAIEDGKTPAVLRLELSGVHKIDQLAKYTSRLANQINSVCRPEPSTLTIIAVLGRAGNVVEAGAVSDLGTSFERCAARHVSVQRFPKAKANGLFGATLRFPQ